MLFDALNKQDMVSAKEFKSFYDWDQWQTKHMRPNVPGIKKFHVFTVDANYKNGCVMTRLTHNGAPKDDLPIITGKKAENFDWIWSTPDCLSELGLADIKHVELHDKWKPLIPQQYWKDFRYYREEPTQAKRKAVHKEKACQQTERDKHNNNSTTSPIQLV